MLKKYNIWMFAILVMGIGIVTAQDATCSEIQRAAYDAVIEYCPRGIDYGLCYGNPTISVDYNEMGDDTLRFTLPGDRVPHNTIDWLRTSSEGNTWGAVNLFFLAYADNVSSAVLSKMIIFGDASVHNTGTIDITMFIDSGSISSRQGANLRAEPSTEGEVIETLMYQSTVWITGKLADDSWVRVHTSTDEFAWLATEAVAIYDISRILVVDPNEQPEPLTSPLQSFDFQSGLPIASCDGGGLSGILLQTYSPYSPELKRNIPPTFYINGLSIQVDGTVFLQAHPNTGLLVSVIDGIADLSALGESQTVETGYVSRVFMELNDEEYLLAVEPPSTPLAYEYDELVSLPLDLLGEGTTLGRVVAPLITPRPIGGESPIAGMALNAPCKLTTGESGANIRSAPSPDGSILMVLGYRESAEPVARVIGSDGLPWWKLADGAWIRIDTTVTGGDCASVPREDFDG